MTLNGFLRSLRGELIRQLRGPRLHIWLAYRSHANRQGLAWPSNWLLTEETGYCHKVVSKETSWLLKSKWLKWEGKFRSRVRVYRVQVPANVGTPTMTLDANPVGTPSVTPDANVGTPTMTLDQYPYYDPLKSSIVSQPLKEEVLRSVGTIDRLDRLWDFFLGVTHQGRRERLTPLRRQVGEDRFQEAVTMCGGDVTKGTQLMRLAIEAMAIPGSDVNYWEIVFSSPAVFQRWLNNMVDLPDLPHITGARTIDHPGPEGSQ